MKRRRKTQSERNEERRVADERVWQDFEPKLANLQSFEEAVRLAHEGPPPDAPGRKYYSKFAFFLGDFTPPAGGSIVEYSLYLKFVKRLDAAGKLKKGALAEIEQKFAQAMKNKEASGWS